LHEIAHAIDKHAMLEAQKERDDAFRQVNQNFLQSDPVVEEAEKWEGEASEAEGQIALLSLEIAMKLNEKIRVAGQGVEGEFLSAAREFYLAGQVSAKAPLEDHDQQYVDARKKLQGAGKQANPWPDLAEKLSSVDKFVIQFVKASRWLKQKAEEIQNAKKKSKAEDVSRKENLAGKEENLKEASAQSPKLKDKSRRLENFVAFVEKYAISPKITPYSEQSWKEGKYGEFFAEAYSLFLAEPEFLRKNYQPLFLYFQTGKHRK
jgi:hypothetical protein